jgi:hypothetical protein
MKLGSILYMKKIIGQPKNNIDPCQRFSSSGHHTLINCDDPRDESVKAKWDELQSFEGDQESPSHRVPNIITDASL